MAGSPRHSLLRSRDVSLLWTAGLLSFTGSLAMFVALPVTVYSRTGSPAVVALVATAGLIPPVLLGPVAGVLADRWDRRRLLVLGNVTLAIACAGYLAIPASAWPWMLLASFTMSCIGQIVSPAEHALFPRLAGEDRLGEAAGLNALNNSLARLIGPALGGLLAAGPGFSSAVLLQCCLFLLSAALIGAIRFRDPTTEVQPSSKPGLREQLADGARILASHRRMRIILGIAVLVALGEGFITALLAPWTADVLGDDGLGLGLILAGQAVGGILGSLWATRRIETIGPTRLLCGAGICIAALLSATFAGGTLTGSFPLVLILTVATGAPFAIFAAAHGATLLQASPSTHRGRIFSLFGMTTASVQLAAVPIAGSLAEVWTVHIITLDAAMYLAAGLLALRLRRESSRPLVSTTNQL